MGKVQYKIRPVHDSDVPGGIRETGKWHGLWNDACSLLEQDGDTWNEVRFDSKEEVERARTAMLSYSRRANEPWRIKTHTSPLRPAILYLKKVSK